jgi:hypothetical protein
MNLTDTIVPKSDQLNADDLIAGPITVTVAEVVAGNTEQPVDVRLIEYPGRAYRPSKSMRRVLVSAWTADGALYTGRRLTLYRNPDIMFGRDKVGGIEISHLSHIDKPLTVALTATRGKRKNFTVQPIPAAAPARDWLAELEQAAVDVTAIGALGQAASAAGAPAQTIDAIRAAFQAAKEAAS